MAADKQLSDLKRAYQTLNVPACATTTSIKKAYRQLLKRWHPDLYSRGASMSAPTRLKPSRRKVVRVSGERRNASIGNGARAAVSCPERRTMGRSVWQRDSAQAIPGVPAMASRAGRPKRLSR